MLYTESCLFYLKEDNCGKDGRAKPPGRRSTRTQTASTRVHVQTQRSRVWPRKDGRWQPEGWINFEAEIDRMFALVSELNRCNEIWETLSKLQVSEIHYCTCFLLWMIPHRLHNAFCSKDTSDSPGRRSRSPAGPRPGQSAAHAGSGTGTAPVRLCLPAWGKRQSRGALKRHWAHVDAFASIWGKGNGGRELVRDSGVEASGVGRSQHRDVPQLSSEDTFCVSILVTPLGKSEKTFTNRTPDSWRSYVNIDQYTVWKPIPSGCEEFC